MSATTAIKGFQFSPYKKEDQDLFDRLFEIFSELIVHTSGDVDETLSWMDQLDKEYKLYTAEYGKDEFIEDLKKRGYLKDESKKKKGGGLKITSKTEQNIRKSALNQIFGALRKAGKGNHKTGTTGLGDEQSGELRSYIFGDILGQIAITESIKNAYTNNGVDSFRLTEQDLVVNETHHNAQLSTVLMIDISHSMILYGEDRITPAKKVAMALAELIRTRYPKDSLDIIVFGNDAWEIKLKDLPYLQVGPYHTNTVAGLSLAMDLLRRKKQTNKQIFMITDGKPSCLKMPNGEYYKNSFGLDEYITGKCLNMAKQARKLQIPITTFMIARDEYLTQFVEEFTEANQGKAFYTGLKGLGEMIFEDYERNRKKKLK
ncbi:MAG: VWA domain-containing protein [Flavobacteriales bacterium]|nr:VWA domain-containing protein [Flavobacteriales bacterium]